MANYTITASLTLHDGTPRAWETNIEAVSYREALDIAWATIGGHLDAEGIRGAGGLKMSIIGPNVPPNAHVVGVRVA